MCHSAATLDTLVSNSRQLSNLLGLLCLPSLGVSVTYQLIRCLPFMRLCFDEEGIGMRALSRSRRDDKRIREIRVGALVALAHFS